MANSASPDDRSSRPPGPAPGGRLNRPDRQQQHHQPERDTGATTHPEGCTHTHDVDARIDAQFGTPAQRVARGVAVLDQRVPDWRQRLMDFAAPFQALPEQERTTLVWWLIYGNIGAEIKHAAQIDRSAFSYQSLEHGLDVPTETGTVEDCYGWTLGEGERWQQYDRLYPYWDAAIAGDAVA